MTGSPLVVSEYGWGKGPVIRKTEVHIRGLGFFNRKLLPLMTRTGKS